MELASRRARRLFALAGVPLACAMETPCHAAGAAPFGGAPDVQAALRPFWRAVQGQDTGFHVADVIGVTGQAIPVRITIAADIASPDRGSTFLMFRGLPEGLQFTAGFRVRNAWAVSWRDAGRVALVAREGMQGTFPVEVSFYHGPDLPPLKQVVTVEIRPPETREARVAATAAPAAAAQTVQALRQPAPLANTAAVAAAVPRRALGAPEESRMLANGRNFVTSGNIASARFVFEDMAARGSAEGAFALAQTYDPQFLMTILVIGPKQANPDEARKWYRAAARMGHREAEARLRAMEGGQP
jgi:hypothetical protein